MNSWGPYKREDIDALIVVKYLDHIGKVLFNPHVQSNA
jgi:hypothetical protein